MASAQWSMHPFPPVRFSRLVLLLAETRIARTLGCVSVEAEERPDVFGRASTSLGAAGGGGGDSVDVGGTGVDADGTGAAGDADGAGAAGGGGGTCVDAVGTGGGGGGGGNGGPSGGMIVRRNGGRGAVSRTQAGALRSGDVDR
eukprot:5597018-Prymnesium_polylepis.1